MIFLYNVFFFLVFCLSFFSRAGRAFGQVAATRRALGFKIIDNVYVFAQEIYFGIFFSSYFFIAFYFIQVNLSTKISFNIYSFVQREY